MTASKRILIIAGPNGAGKTVFATEFLSNDSVLSILHQRRSHIGGTESVSTGLGRYATGGIDFCVPRPHLEAIGLRPNGRWVYELTDGRKIKLEFPTGDIEFMGKIVGTTIVFGEVDA